MHCFSTLFAKELYIFRTDLLSIIKSLNTVFTAIGICRMEILKGKGKGKAAPLQAWSGSEGFRKLR